MSLPNRVDPFGNLFADASRGLLFGNRGGRFHRHDRTLGARRWVSRRWICCRLDFKGRHRNVWGAGYTELFFLDEPTALAAGHRPCFECRRADAQAFAAAFARDHFGRADEIDRVLHAERLDGRGKRRHRCAIDGLPDGSMITLPEEPGRAFAVRGPALLRWASTGYIGARPRPRHLMVDVLTPPGTLAALSAALAPERRRAIALTNKKPYRVECPRKLPSALHQPATLFAQRRAGSGTCPSKQQTRSADRERIDSTQLWTLSRAAP